jgi:hypothetical protein
MPKNLGHGTDECLRLAIGVDDYGLRVAGNSEGKYVFCEIAVFGGDKVVDVDFADDRSNVISFCEKRQNVG